MKGVILTPDIAKIFHPTPDIKGKKCPTPDIQNLSRHPTPNLRQDCADESQGGSPFARR